MVAGVNWEYMMADVDKLIEELRKENPEAAFWVSKITDLSGTWDADWSVLKAAACLLADLDAEARQWHTKYFTLSKNIKELLERY